MWPAFGKLRDSLPFHTALGFLGLPLDRQSQDSSGGPPRASAVLSRLPLCQGQGLAEGPRVQTRMLRVLGNASLANAELESKRLFKSCGESPMVEKADSGEWGCNAIGTDAQRMSQTGGVSAESVEGTERVAAEWSMAFLDAAPGHAFGPRSACASQARSEL